MLCISRFISGWQQSTTFAPRKAPDQRDIAGELNHILEPCSASRRMRLSVRSALPSHRGCSETVPPQRKLGGVEAICEFIPSLVVVADQQQRLPEIVMRQREIRLELQWPGDRRRSRPGTDSSRATRCPGCTRSWASIVQGNRLSQDCNGLVKFTGL